MADLSDNFINSICFALALLYLALQAWRLARPFWAMRFEGKLAQLKKLMADNGLTFTEKELRRAVPADYAINTLLHRELTDAREIECRSAFRRSLALFAAALLLTMGLGFFLFRPHGRFLRERPRPSGARNRHRGLRPLPRIEDTLLRCRPNGRKESRGHLTYAFAGNTGSPFTVCSRFLMSRPGASPKSCLYSRENCVGLSYPTA